MERTEMIEILTFLYDRRLKALLCYQHTDFTRVLVEYMFRRFDEISATDEKQPMFTENVQSYIGEVLLYGTKERNQSDALLAVTNLTVVLENYIRCTAYCFWPKEMEKKEKIGLVVEGGGMKWSCVYRQKVWRFGKDAERPFPGETVSKIHCNPVKTCYGHPEPTSASYRVRLYYNV